MLNKLHLEIENNNDLSNNYTVMINGKVINMEKHKDILEYNYVTKSDKCEINIYGGNFETKMSLYKERLCGYQYLIFNLEIQWRTCLSLHITQRILILMRNRNTICT